ncbi:Crp/Fnr family transcriptional regulator [Photobacterium sp. J15]|uniref:Crp/Fnr family transcriptional regulator n=1 Tax=Photobacterium sp. J15 TaxID=265901 RepID=UPI0007E34CF4|nr:Crp/Fnr family transcriptional regulator [Photobacterium sp. J15]
MTINNIALEGHQELTKLIKNQTFKTRHLEEGDFIVKQGQTISDVYWADLGQYTIRHTASNGRCLNLGLFFSIDRLFGEVELLTGQPCQFDVIATEPMDILIIPSGTMTEMMLSDPRIAFWVSKSLSVRYQETMTIAMNRILHPLVYNVAWDIEQRHLQNIPQVNFSLVHKEAQRFGCSERVYSRVVKQLIDAKLVKKENNQLEVINIEKLCRFLAS